MRCYTSNPLWPRSLAARVTDSEVKTGSCWPQGYPKPDPTGFKNKKKKKKKEWTPALSLVLYTCHGGITQSETIHCLVLLVKKKGKKKLRVTDQEIHDLVYVLGSSTDSSRRDSTPA